MRIKINIILEAKSAQVCLATKKAISWREKNSIRTGNQTQAQKIFNFLGIR